MKEIIVTLILATAIVGMGFWWWYELIQDNIAQKPVTVNGRSFYVSELACERATSQNCYYLPCDLVAREVPVTEVCPRIRRDWTPVVRGNLN